MCHLQWKRHSALGLGGYLYRARYKIWSPVLTIGEGIRRLGRAEISL